MVDAVVSFVVDRLGDLLNEQVVFLLGVKDDVEWLRGKLENILCFLKDADEKQDIDHRMHKWICDIRDVAYEAEDIIDNFILKVEAETPKKMGLIDSIEKYFCICSKHSFLIQQANIYGVGQEIKTLKMKLTQIQQNQVAFGIKSIGDAREGSNSMNTIHNWQQRERPYKDNEHVVGFENDAKNLESELFKDVKDRYVISIVGTGGLGKTTMARKLYNTLSPTNKFDCYAWVSVSTDYQIQDLLRSTIKSFKMPSTKEELEFLEKMKEDDLEHYLRDYLKGNRYLVVLDDVWDVKAWPSMMRAFPDEKNGSRAIMTTRNKDVALPSDERTHVHELRFLNSKESWELFCRKAFPDNKEIGCPPHLESLAEEMARKCGGLPLAIVVLGGLLRKKDQSHLEWLKVKENMWCRVLNHDSYRVQHILALSFNDLPYRLKSCFLYMGLFPEDYEIEAKKLCRLWEAEGFIKVGEESFEEEEEDAAEAHLRELVDRSLIQVADRNWTGILYCRVHDLLRDFAIEKSKEINFLHIYKGTLPPNSRSRRLASHCGFKKFVSLDHSGNGLRTILSFNSEKEDLEIAKLQSLWSTLRLVRVLDLERILFGGSKKMKRLADEIGKLFHLRYLGLNADNSNMLSQFIGNLHALQTLDMRSYTYTYGCASVQLPDEICKATQLRHLIGRFNWPFPVKNLKNLLTLYVVVVHDQMEFDPKDVINLRELQVAFVGDSNNRITVDSIGKLTSLRTLRLCVEISRTAEVRLQSLGPCQHLRELKLEGPSDWKLPTVGLPNLRNLFLNAGGLTEDPKPMLEKLPRLTVLYLYDYKTKNKWVCTAGAFPQLEILQLVGVELQLEFQVEEEGMPVLKGLLIERSNVSIPVRLSSISAPHPPLVWDGLSSVFLDA